MKKCHYTLFVFVCSASLTGQTIRNFGDMEIHSTAKFGLFHHTVNDGSFNNSGGLLGFYGDKSIHVSGSTPLTTFDLEIANDMGIHLEIPITVTNHSNFVFGNVNTPKDTSNEYLEFSLNADYTGASSFSKVNGFVLAHIMDSFLFPVGDEFYIRPISVITAQPNYSYLSSFQFDDPTERYGPKHNSIMDAIHTREFWTLEGNGEVNITLSWDERSKIHTISRSIDEIHIVGFEKGTSKWVDLGGLHPTGDLGNGFVSSIKFIPNDFGAFTFGSSTETGTDAIAFGLKAYHYLVTPNNDGINDRLIIEGLAEFERNRLQIYDRNGLMVFDAENYTDEFDGTAGLNIPALNRDAGLPEGIYFYLASVNGGTTTIQGFLYLDR